MSCDSSSLSLRAIVERFLLLWLTLLSLLAYFWQQWFPDAWDPFVGTKPALNVLIAVTMFAIGSLLPRDEVRQVARRWPMVLGGTTVQYLSMPLLAYLVALLFGFEGATLVGVIMVGCVPGAMASNVLSLAARANVSYSVSLTTTATLLSPIMVPLTLKLTLGQWRPIPVGQIFHSLFLTVVVPVVLGYLASRLWPRWEIAARRVGPVIANLTILWIIAIVVGLNHDRLADFESAILLALLIINLVGYVAGYCGGGLLRLGQPMRGALTLEVGMQNAGVGTWLVLTVFNDEPAAAIPPAIYTFGCMFTGTMLARLWAEFGGRGEKPATQQ